MNETKKIVRKPRKPHKQSTKEQQREIIAKLAIGKPIEEISKEFDYSKQTIINIVNRNIDKFEKYQESMNKSMIIGAGCVGNLAIEELKNKNLNKEKAGTLSSIAVDMNKIIHNNDNQVNIQINNQIPTNRTELLSFLSNNRNTNVIDNTTDTTE